MVQMLAQKPEQNIKSWMETQCNHLLHKWVFELNDEEKEVWLWNSMVAMKRIECRRGIKSG